MRLSESVTSALVTRQNVNGGPQLQAVGDSMFADASTGEVFEIGFQFFNIHGAYLGDATISGPAALVHEQRSHGTVDNLRIAMTTGAALITAVNENSIPLKTAC